MNDWHTIEQAITEATGKTFKVDTAQPLGGGDINTVYRLQGNQSNY